MRSPRSFMARSSWVVTGLASLAMGRRARRPSGIELRQLALPEGAVRKLRVRDHERRLVDYPITEAHDVQVQGPPPPANSALAAALRFDRMEVDERPGGTDPRGAVSSTRDSPTRRVRGRAASRARAYARCAARSPTFDPSATYTRSVSPLATREW